MLVIRILISFAPLIQSVSATMKNLHFGVLERAANLVYSDHLLFDSTARSKLSCVELCAVTECCVRFTFTGKRGAAGVCRGHSTPLLLSDQGTHTAGATTYVWTELEDANGDPHNVALHKEASQSSTYEDSSASKAIDGNPNPNWEVGSCSHTALDTGEAWWQVDLGGVLCNIFSIIITNRGECCGWRLRDFNIHTYKENPEINPSAPGTLCIHYDGPMAGGVTKELVCINGPIRGRFVRVTNSPGEPLTLCEVQVIAVWV